MERSLQAIAKMREHMVMGRALVEQLADIALAAPPDIATQIEHVCELAHRLVSENLAAVDLLVAAYETPLSAA